MKKINSIKTIDELVKILSSVDTLVVNTMVGNFTLWWKRPTKKIGIYNGKKDIYFTPEKFDRSKYMVYIQDSPTYIDNLKEGQTLDGGKGDHLSPKDVDKNELRVGIEVEYEHAEGDKIAALDIALDHLEEDPKYYSTLIKSGLVDEPKAIKLAKKLLGVEPMNMNESIGRIIREELKNLLKEEPELWKYIHNFGSTYIPKKQGK